MPRILLVKTSSLGDVVHNLPVASDIAAAHPGAEIDWVVEAPFASIAGLHPAVRRALHVAVREWRARAWQPATQRAVRAFVQTLRESAYDAIIDTQGLFKSALIARLARGTRHGLDWASSREPLALFYDRTYAVPRSVHAVERNRRLAGAALWYEPPARIDYGIRAPHAAFTWLSTANYAVLLHSTSAHEKLWPEARWIALGRALAARGLRSVLPWGSAGERQRSARIAAAIDGALMPPRLPLEAVASLLAGARCAIGVDTGVTHLAAALGVATVGIYTATEPALTGLYGCARAANVGGCAANPPVEEVLTALEMLAP